MTAPFQNVIHCSHDEAYNSLNLVIQNYVLKGGNSIVSSNLVIRYIKSITMTREEQDNDD
jgi:hypothetical protein